MLQQAGKYNDFSQKLKKALEDKITSFGKTVRYKFNISHDNPDPEKKDGPIIWPHLYTLDPVTFKIVDKEENRPDKQNVKEVGYVRELNEKGIPVSFFRIRVRGRDKGIITYNLELPEHQDEVMLLELHPKNTNGMFSDKTKQQVFSRIDEHALATDKKKERTAKLKALNVAQGMSDKEVVDFADAMVWDSTAEPLLLRNQIEELAETNPDFFNDLVEGKTVEFQAAVKKAIDRQIIGFDPGEYKFMWRSNNQTIAVLQLSTDKNEIEKFSEWLMTAGEKADAVYKKIQGLLK